LDITPRAGENHFDLGAHFSMIFQAVFHYDPPLLLQRQVVRRFMISQNSEHRKATFPDKIIFASA
jgi:hypothetical protein